MEDRLINGHLDGQEGALMCPEPKAVGAFLGLAAGDALGWPQELPRKRIGIREEPSPSEEFQEWTRRDGWRGTAHSERIGPGEYSDDTQLMLATARSLCFGKDSWLEALTGSELPLWTLYQRGGGGATKRAAGSWLRGVPPWTAPRLREQYFRAGGNGVAMRIVPHSVFHAGSSDPSALIRNVVADGCTTHGHPRALIGAAAFAFAAWWLLRIERRVKYGELLNVLRENSNAWGGFEATSSCSDSWFQSAVQTSTGDYETLWQQVTEEMLDLLRIGEAAIRQGGTAEDHKVLKGLGCFGREKGSGTRSAAAAIYLCSRHAASPVVGVLTAAFAHGADTDTLAAMTGALLGGLSGVDQLPTEWESVQDAKYIRFAAESVIDASDSSIFAKPSVLPRQIRLRQIKEFKNLLDLETTESMEFDGVRQVIIESSGQLQTFSKAMLTRVWTLRTTDGQLLYVKKSSRVTVAPRGGHSSFGRSKRTSPNVSPNTAAILLLTATLARHSESKRREVLSDTEYQFLAARLRNLSSQPSDLLGARSNQLIQECSCDLGYERIARLVSRRKELDEAFARWSQENVWVISRADKEYPRKIKQNLGQLSPPLLFGIGSQGILDRTGISVLGSNTTSAALRSHARNLGAMASGEGRALLSVGRTALDRSAIRGAVETGGCVLLIDNSKSMWSHSRLDQSQSAIENRFARIGLQDPTLRFVVRTSKIDDRRLLYALADLDIIVDAPRKLEYPSNYAREVIAIENGARIFVCLDEGKSEGLQSLLDQGARPWPSPINNEALDQLLMDVRSQASIHRNRSKFSTAQEQVLAQKFLSTVSEFICTLAREPVTASKVAESLRVRESQAKAWLQSLASQGLLEELSLIDRYRTKRPHSTLRQSSHMQDESMTTRRPTLVAAQDVPVTNQTSDGTDSN